MQKISTLFSTGAIVLFANLIATPTLATTMTFTATRVLEVSDRHSPAEKFLKNPIRLNSELKTLLLPRTNDCVVEYCNEQLQYAKLQLVQFQKIAGTVTHVKAIGKITLENGVNHAEVMITGNNNQSAKMVITTVSADGMYKSQATLEGYFAQSVF